MLTVGEKIRSLRNRNNLTQEELGNKLGVKKVTIQKYENGSIKNLKQTTISKLSEIFNVDPSYFISMGNSFDDKLGEKVCNLKEEVLAIERFQKNYGNDVIEIIKIYNELDEVGKERVMQYINDMSKIY